MLLLEVLQFVLGSVAALALPAIALLDVLPDA